MEPGTNNVQNNIIAKNDQGEVVKTFRSLVEVADYAGAPYNDVIVLIQNKVLVGDVRFEIMPWFADEFAKAANPESHEVDPSDFAMNPETEDNIEAYMENVEAPTATNEMKAVDIRLNHQDEVAAATAEGRGMRFNSGKRKWSLVDFESFEPMVEVLEFGAKKYAADQWKNGLDKKEILESAFRHLTALMAGEVNDPESGLHHIGHLACNVMFYSYFTKEER